MPIISMFYGIITELPEESGMRSEYRNAFISQNPDRQ